MLIERAQAQGRDGNITICHVLLKKAILLHKRPKVSYSFSLTVCPFNVIPTLRGQMGGLGVSILDPTPCGYTLGQYQMPQHAKSHFFQK